MKVYAKKTIVISLIFIMTSIIFLIQIPVYAKSSIKKNVLILNSYVNESEIVLGSQSKKWTSEIISSINSEFTNNIKDITVEMEYMDSNDNIGDEYWQQLYNLYKYKYKDDKFDVVIALDDNAFNFLRKYGDELFPNTPVIFSGVNNFNESMISDNPLFTGLAKSNDIQATIDIGLKLHPNAKQVFVVLDKTSNGQRYKKMIEDIVPLYKDKINFLFSEEENITKVKDEIDSLPKDTIIYFDATLKNDTGNYVSIEDSVDILFKDINIPVYSKCYIQINKESVGGMITEGDDLGKEIGKLALRIFDGEKASDIPVVEDSSHKYEFNYSKLKQFNINIGDLPKGSEIINENPYYNISQNLIKYIIVSIIFIIILVVIFAKLSVYKRRLAEKLLAENENLLKTLINATPDIIYFKDANNRLIEANNSILDLLNIEEMDYKLKKIEELPLGSSLMIKNLISFNAYDEKAWESNKIFRTEETILYEKLGVNKIYDIIRIPLFNDDGTRKGLVLLGRDITERKQMEDQLKRSKEIAEAANTTKGNFLAGISHEIRTPINAIIGFSELMMDLVNDIKQKEYIETINIAGRNLLALINDTLDLSKIEVGKLEINYSPVNLRTILEEIKKVFQKNVSDKEIEFIIEVDEKLPQEILMDEIRLRQILLNVVGNAVKFTDVGHVKISIKAIKKEEIDVSNSNLIDIIIHIEDTGIGIPEQDQHRIFESFAQQSRQNIKKFGGTGLGLSISKKLIEMMNGSISLISSVNKGSTFTITFHDVHILSDKITFYEEKHTCYNKIKFMKAKVLVVDDAESNRCLIKEILKNFDLKVMTAENGVEAIKIAKKEMPNIIIMDNQMPIMNGIHAINAIRKVSYLKNVPIILISADENEKILDVGINDYMTKPININHFFEILQKWLKPLDEFVAVTKLEEISNVIDENHNCIPKIDGIDIDTGVKRLCGNKKLYIKMLVKFCKDNKELIIQIKKAIKYRKHDDILSLLHRLKGVSGNLSITSIYKATIAFETKIKQNIPCDYIKLFYNISDNFEKISDEIFAFEKKNQWIGSEKNSLKLDIVSKSEILYYLSKLKNYLQDYDVKAVEYMEEIKEKFAGFLDTSDIENIEEKVIIYEFDAALDYINVITSKINNIV